MVSAEPALLEAEEIARHYHPRPYATLVLEGGYEEAGDQGRYQVGAGDVLLHTAFSAHRDIIHRSRTYVLDLVLPFDGARWPGLGRVADPDQVIHAARRDVRQARELLVEALMPVNGERDDPADLLADVITDDPSLAIGEWAQRNGFCREWLSRRFRRLYGVDSALFRSEARSRRAWRMIVDSDEGLAQIAHGCGFADQAHMTRAVGRLTGRSPAAWRRHRAVTSVQESDRRAG